MKLIKLAILIICFFINCDLVKANTQEVNPIDVVGRWITHTGGITEFTLCEGSICGRLEWEPKWEETGIVPMDENNPDKSLRARSFKGLTILYDFKETNGGWRKGVFYDPWFGKSYSVSLTRTKLSTLRLSACIAFTLCKSFDWEKVTPDTDPLLVGNLSKKE